ncbi:MAG: pyocin R2, holin [Pseudomonas stutzeri]|uniref:phage holin family protein n=1 Tax=Stutzerimonas stutzeri TaxID=316 RepID=UPI0016928865|nr:pyocin R2, holin [Stutzerimonas stutzeri]NIM53612.1 pyocin R2, holin [Stutzerimonas stutzeri]NIM85919.1 pyocin R2, holin [Stutzerimonas stutzeri]NIN80515.1 pyocin R2, holin [Stutzerimonas stutzeri]NIO99761.1 pyocin R2, holin [Stutzerimonas stutzeri]
MSTEQQVQQSLADLPTWLLILVALAGLTGEMWRADAAGMAVGELIKRVLLRFGASAVFGLATVLLATAWGSSLLTSAALGSVVACLGADVASGLYARWLARRAGVCDEVTKAAAESSDLR